MDDSEYLSDWDERFEKWFWAYFYAQLARARESGKNILRCHWELFPLFVCNPMFMRTVIYTDDPSRMQFAGVEIHLVSDEVAGSFSV